VIDDEVRTTSRSGNERVLPRCYIFIIPHSSSVARVFLEPTAKFLESPMGKMVGKYQLTMMLTKLRPLLIIYTRATRAS
jgi:hypothetical protein